LGTRALFITSCVVSIEIHYYALNLMVLCLLSLMKVRSGNCVDRLDCNGINVRFWILPSVVGDLLVSWIVMLPLPPYEGRNDLDLMA